MHRFVPDESTPADPAVAAAETAALKRWVREFLGLGEEAVISVLTTPCVEPACPIVETALIVQVPGSPIHAWRFQRPRAAVNRLTLQQVLATPGFTGSTRAAADSPETGVASDEPGLPPPSGT